MPALMFARNRPLSKRNAYPFWRTSWLFSWHSSYNLDAPLPHAPTDDSGRVRAALERGFRGSAVDGICGRRPGKEKSTLE